MDWSGENTYSFDEETQTDSVTFQIYRSRASFEETDFEFPLEEEFEVGFAYNTFDGVLAYHENKGGFMVTIPQDGTSAFGE